MSIVGNRDGTLVQVELHNEETDATMVCWVEHDSRLKAPGVRLTLKQFPDIIWTLRNVYRGIQLEPGSLRRRWNVGGLA